MQPASTDPLMGEEELAGFLERFNELFPTERDCMEELYRMIEEEGFATCRYCGKAEMDRKRGERTFWCKCCKKRSWITGGTFFHGIRAARPWLIAIWLIENRFILSSSKFHKITGIAQSSAWLIFKKITMVIEGQVCGINVPTRMFVQIFCKRSRETPAREHPKEEQREIEREQNARKLLGKMNEAVEQNPGAMKAEGIENAEGGVSRGEPALVASMTKEESLVYKELSLEPLSTDFLSQKTGIEIKELLVALTMLELSGAITRVPGNRYVKIMSQSNAGAFFGSSSCLQNKFVAQPLGGRMPEAWLDRGTEQRPEQRPEQKPGKSPQKDVRTMIEANIRFIRRRFHGISRKYVQNYLTTYRYYVDWDKWVGGTLLKRCLRYGRLDYAQILAYVSPPLVKM